MTSNTEKQPGSRCNVWEGCDPELVHRAKSLWEANPWLQSGYPNPLSPAYWLWIVNFGLRQFPSDLGDVLPPIPPAERMIAVSGNSDLASFLNAGSEAVTRLDDAVFDHGRDLADAGSLLDFGCGCGRVIRHLQPYARMGTTLWGSDVDEDAIRWCRENLTFARFSRNSFEPPLEFADGTFDIVSSVSVFTHLAAPLQHRWSAELARVAAPGAIFAISIHGEHAWRKVIDDPDALRGLNISLADVAEARASWKSSGFAFLGQLALSDFVEQSQYGFVFVQPDWINRTWPGFRVREVRSAAISDWQDLVILESRD